MMLSSPDQLAATPKRIVSLVPSQTELLHYLGLEEETVGITKFCIHPKEWFRSKTNIGGTKNINIKRILQLQPDLVIANKEENIKEQVEELAKHVPVWVTDVNNIKDAHKMILDIGALTRKKVAAKKLAAKIETAFRQVSPPVNKINTCYLIWKNPYMSIGKDTFIHDVLKQSGFKNIFSSEKRYPKVTVALIQELKPKLIMLSSEPYPFKEKHIAELQQQLPDSKVILVDGELFSWYGSRMILLPDYLKQLKQLLTN
jgi:ABC-type Fe3+-hydroxamate transport system substrate-binding protein